MGRGSYDPRRPNVATGVGSTSGGPKASINRPAAAAPVGTPAPQPRAPVTFAKVNLPPAPTTPRPTANSAALRATAAQDLATAKTQNRDAIYRAVMNLGDPTQFAQYQNDPNFAGYQFTQDPNSLFATLARQETQGLEDIDKSANAGNTFFSGLRLQNRQDLTDETGRQRLAGSTSFSDNLKELAAALGLAQSQYERDIGDADQMDIDAALEQDRINRENYAAATPVAPPAPPPIKQTRTPAQERKAAQEFERKRRKKK